MGWNGLQPAPKGGNGNKRPFGGNQSGGFEKKPKFDSPGGGKGKGKGKGSPGGGKGAPPAFGSACKQTNPNPNWNSTAVRKPNRGGLLRLHTASLGRLSRL